VETFSFAYDAVEGYEIEAEYSTDITDFGAGVEQLNSNWEIGRRTWTISFRKDTTDTASILAFFDLHKGAGTAFYWTDPLGDLLVYRFQSDKFSARVQGGIAAFSLTLTRFRSTDTTPPTVSSVTPASGANSGSLSANVVWVMSEKILPADVTATYFHVIDSTTGASVAGTLALASNGTTVTFDPTGSWTLNGIYLPRVEAGVHDLSGNKLAAAYGSHFHATAA